MKFKTYNLDCRDVMDMYLADNSVDSIVTDPPYGLGFMGKEWDHGVPGTEFWERALRVLKPGGHLLAFSGSRTYHRMVCAIEDAGFEIRDQIMWVYGSGFPKSLDVSKAIDKAAGAEREVVGSKLGLPGYHLSPHDGGEALGHGLSSSTYETRLSSSQITAPATDAAKQWQGWGTALKPAHEPIVVARKPLIGTVATNVLTHGTGALNIDGCRVATNGEVTGGSGASKIGTNALGDFAGNAGNVTPETGRWPANLIHDGSAEVTAQFPQTTSGARKAAQGGNGTDGVVAFRGKPNLNDFAADSGSAARFFYCAKASKKDRDEGMGDAPVRVMAMSNQAKAELARGNMHEGDSGMNSAKLRQNNHPTVKPTDLMAYLCRLVTPPGGIVLDPFMGSGSTGKAAVREGFRFIGCELETEYHLIADARLKAAL